MDYTTTRYLMQAFLNPTPKGGGLRHVIRSLSSLMP